jgi:L-alanine-DL-glutamate epimerase-like enolase superfamily enzyme
MNIKDPSVDIPMVCETSSLQSENGLITLPTGPGLGIKLDEDFVKKHKIVNE